MQNYLTVALMALLSCGGGSTGYESAPVPSDYAADGLAMKEVAEESMVASRELPPDPEQEAFEKKVIKSGSLSYQVQDTKKEYQRVNDLLPGFKAYFASESENKSYDRISITLSIRVPPQYFDSLMTTLASDRTVDHRWANINDVTANYYDLKSRIENKQKLEERYQEILKKANNVKDILEVELNLNSVRQEIESLQGQFKMLNTQINHSSLELTFYELTPYELNNEQRPGFTTRIVNALSGGWNGFLSFLVFVIQLWPFAILAFLVVLIVKKVRKNRKHKGS